MENASEGLSEVPQFQLSYGRRRFILKVLDARELHSGLKELHSSLHSLEEQIRNIARDVEGITSLEDSFRGEGAAAIQAFFRECHSPFLLFFEGFLADYQNTLKRIASSLQMLEPASNGFIRQSFLDGEAAHGLVKTESITTSLTEETNAVIQKVSDIVSLPHLQDGEFSAHVRRAELYRQNTVDDLMTFDGQQTLALDPIEQDLHLMQTYINEISSLFQSGNLSVSGYSVKQLHSSPIYGELLGGIRHKAGNSMRSLEFFKELGVTALGQILPPGAYSIWAIWQSTYERKTIQYQLRAMKALAELNSNEISPEEYSSMSGREILTVEVIDEHGIGSQNQGGKFHLYDDGRIVREYYAEKGKAYEFVDSIPEDRVGGVRELDSMADGTPLEILEYLSLAAVVRKQGTKVIRKSINKADFDALVRILKEEKGHVVLPGKKDGKGTGDVQTGGRELSIDEYLKQLDKAEEMYESFRKSKTDVQSIAKNTGMTEQRVQRIKEHLFIKEHIKEHGIGRFDPDYQIAQAWDRLQKDTYNKNDIDLLNHELFESKFEGIFKTDYRTAHDKTVESGRPWYPLEEE
ncbi:LXG domain-containing protein [Cytobacillus oceanisediminis]|uniref:ribonuclease YeeF family protein n=1 Tax=Cytobacillus oceanisediminis TaxID=665099 RepID=UPI0023D97DBC|nr:LXG domain-containing protein [Cytobacillus oceanisediminis]MDF2035578.1 LXG domain-containing protein [Cytobacillus oceanisediminis]